MSAGGSRPNAYRCAECGHHEQLHRHNGPCLVLVSRHGNEECDCAGFMPGNCEVCAGFGCADCAEEA